MNPGERKHLFINYATEDGLFVDWLCLKLAAEGYLIWCDRGKLLGGESYPRDIDAAIKDRTFRFLSVLSRSSISKPNPLKERTLALRLAQDRHEDFVIPLNLDGLSPAELGWMQSDLTFVPFHHGWAAGLAQLLRKLETVGAPRRPDGRAIVSRLLNQAEALRATPERLWSNLAQVRSMPTTIYRYEHELGMPPKEAAASLAQWPHFRENATVCWSFTPPPVELAIQFGFKARGQLENWESAESPDVDARNLGKSVINASLMSLCMARGLSATVDGNGVYFPPGLVARDRLIYEGYEGRNWVKTVGLRTFRTGTSKEIVRYHLAPVLRVMLDYYGKTVIRVQTRLVLTELTGKPLDARRAFTRRRAICKNWWNHQWLARVFATLYFLAADQAQILVGAKDPQQLVVDKVPISLTATHSIDELALKPITAAVEDSRLIERPRDEEERLEETPDEEGSGTGEE